MKRKHPKLRLLCGILILALFTSAASQAGAVTQSEIDALKKEQQESQAKQQELYENKLQRLIEEGYSYENAVTEAGTVVAVPGTSEHQTGLALDIVDASYQILDQGQEDTLVQQWLIEHSWEYGFVLRYPNAKSEITGIIYEPWHYRYVGREAAREMTELDLCLEEYVDWLSAQ